MMSNFERKSEERRAKSEERRANEQKNEIPTLVFQLRVASRYFLLIVLRFLKFFSVWRVAKIMRRV